MTPLSAAVRRSWGELVGPEATALDTAVALGAGIVGLFVAPVLARRRASVTRGDAVLVGALAADLWGGAWANNTRACARWYERPGQSDADHVRFVLLHVHPAAVAWVDRRRPGRRPAWVWPLAHYGYVVAATVLIRRWPRVRRPLGVVFTVGGLVLSRRLGSSSSTPWFSLAYYPKLLMGHAAASLWSDDVLHRQV